MTIINRCHTVALTSAELQAVMDALHLAIYGLGAPRPRSLAHRTALKRIKALIERAGLPARPWGCFVSATKELRQ